MAALAVLPPIPDEVLDLDVFLVMDYSQCEIRILAEISGDKLLIEQFGAPDADIHSAVGSQLTGWSVERIKNESNVRKMVKNMIFGTCYGIGRENLYDYIVGKIREIDGENADLTGITKKKVTELYDKFFRTYSGVKRYIDEYRKMAEETGKVSTLFGFVREIQEHEDGRGTYWLNQAINCVDFSTEILTARGWVNGKDLQRTDQCLTETGWQVPCRISRFPKYKGPVHIWKSRGFSAVSTPEHRWKIFNQKTGASHIYTSASLPKFSHYGYGVHRTIPEVPVKETLDDNFIELCGWVLTDGYYSSCNGTGFGVSQSKPATKKRIQDLMNRIGITTGYEDTNKCHYWYVGGKLGKYVRALFPKRTLTFEFISSLSRRQANLLIDVMLLGDGNNEANKLGKRQMGCGTPEKATAFEMLCAWAGHSTYRKEIPPGRSARIRKTGQLVTQKKPFYVITVLRRKHAQIWKEYETIGRGNGVWCPTFADDSAWVARRDGHTFITKNTPVQSSAHQLILMAMALLHLRPRTYNLLQRLCLEVHDALVFFVKLRHLHEAYKQARQLLQVDVVEYAAKHFGRRLRVPMIAEGKAGFNLGSTVLFTGQPLEQFLVEWRAKHKSVEEKGWKKLLDSKI